MKLILEHRMADLAGILGSSSTQRTMDEMIREAMSEKKLVSFDYDSFHRIAELHVYGRQNDKNGILAHQIGGQSSDGDLGWKIMYVNKITNMKVLDETFQGKRETTGKHTSWEIRYFVIDW
ncbi:MAG: hypothetical protein RI100_07360 [Nitrosarchaeum sp.]|jgi:hypothetical protein|uniref:hypothetical protein n=1 Tax=Nitrosarchaeum sp. TaxID=2026886 RepID=UPI002DF5C2E7|nr:hypothetical protein [Nitrosarchaeum sp.]